MSPTTLFSTEKRSKLLYGTAALVLCLLIGIGIFGKNGWLPHTDSFSGKKTGWFGKELPKNASSSWNPLAPPLPTPTPQLAREYLYAGSRLLAVEDANASAAPPADLAIWRPSDQTWWVLGGQGSQQVTQQWGVSGDVPAQGDYDGDGKTDFSVFRPSTGVWWIINSSNGSNSSVQFGVGTDKLAQADFDGDGKTDMAVFRLNDPSAGLASWYIRKSSDGTWSGFPFGLSSDAPAPADYDGDGRADVGVWRASNSTFYSLRSSDAVPQTIDLSNSVTPGNSATPVSADYDGDGKANFAVRNGASWIILNAAGTSAPTTTPAGDQSSDIPVQNDYDGDGKVDIATWRSSNGHWYIRQSASGTLRDVQWGASGDIPVPAFYRR